MDKDRLDTKGKLRRTLRYLCLRALRKIRRFAPHHRLHWALIVAVILPMIFMYGCDVFGGKKKNPQPASVPVLAIEANIQNVPIYLVALGTVTPINSVTVHAQVDGQLLRVHFKDGQMVQAGDLLAEIDPRPYQALLTQYQGQLIRDQALLANARIDVQRYTTLFAQDSISQQTLETQKYLVIQYEGAVKADQGQIDTVKVNLIYCKITAPIAGRLGLLEVDPGNIVQTTDTTGIVVINSMSPIYVDFAIPEDSLPQVMQKIAAGNMLTAIAKDRTQNKILATGQLLTTDNQMNTSTGTITLRATFENKDNLLFPNQFVNISLLVDEAKHATVVPTAAIQYGNNGSYVYLINKDNTVSIKPITIITTLDDTTAISSDIKPGQLVVTEGTDKLKEGTLIKVVSGKANVNQESANNGSV